MKISIKLPHRAEDRNRIVGPLIGAALALIFSLLFVTGSLDTVGNFDLDSKFKLRQSFSKTPTNKDLVNVMIEENTLDWEDTFPDDPLKYVPIIQALGKNQFNTRATLFSIDYSRPYTHKIKLPETAEEVEPFNNLVNQVFTELNNGANSAEQYNQQKNALIGSILGYVDFLKDPGIVVNPSELATAMENQVYSQDMGNAFAGLQMFGNNAAQMHAMFDHLAPKRERFVGQAAKDAGNVYFTYEAKNFVSTPYTARDLKNDPALRSLFEKVLREEKRNRPEDPQEGIIFDTYQNLSMKDFDYLVGKEGTPLRGAILERVRTDRKTIIERWANFQSQNNKADKYVFDIPPGLDDAYVHLTSVQPVVPEIGDYTAGQGPRKAEFSPNDGTLRMIAPVYIYNGKIYPHIDLLLAMKYLNVKKKDVILKRDRIILRNAAHPQTKEKKDLTIPLLPGGKMLINWAGVWADTTLFAPPENLKGMYDNINMLNMLIKSDRPFNTLSAREKKSALSANLRGMSKDVQKYVIFYVLKEKEMFKSTKQVDEDIENAWKSLRNPKRFDAFVENILRKFDEYRNKIIIIGLTAEGAAEMTPTPLEGRYKILGLHANVINTIIENLFIRRAHPLLVVLALFVLAVGLGLAGGSVRHQNSIVVALINFLLMIGVALLWFVLSNLIFIKFRLEFPVLIPTTLIVMTFLLVFLYRFLTEEQEKKKMKGMFSNYVNPQVVETLIKDPEKLKLGGEMTHASVYFSDVQGFTSISESLTPEALVELLNEYLTAMTNILLGYGGTLDKYIGDAIVGIFGAPIPFDDHAAKCCFAALDMQAQITEMRKVWKEQGKHQMQVRSGINTGDMICGNMGSTKRFNYTAMGPAVDFGEHNESNGKLYGTQVTISEFTRAEADDLLITRFLDIAEIDGYDKPVKIYELLARKTDGLPDVKNECVQTHNDSVVFFFQRRFDEALKKLSGIYEIFPPNPEDEFITKFLSPTDKLKKRIEEALKNPPDKEFDRLIELATHRKNMVF